MLVFALGCVFVILIVPLAGLAVVARTTWGGLALAAALLACAVGWIWLMAGWVQPDQVADAVLVLAIVTPALIMAGRLADRVAVVRPASPARLRLAKGPRPADRRAASPGRLWLITGRSLSALCVSLNVLVVIVVVVGAIYVGWAYTPPSSDVLPLPPAVTVVSDRDQGCPGVTLHRCTREIDVASAAGLSTEQTAQIVIGALTHLHGWRLNQFESSCRNEGWLLGRENVCVSVQTGQKTVQVLLENPLT